MFSPRSLLLLIVGLATLLCLNAAYLPQLTTSELAAKGLHSQRRLTNSQLLARGLQPNQPRHLYTPDRTRALTPRASINPSIQYVLNIARASDPENIIGYYAVTQANFGLGGLVTDIANADILQLPAQVPAVNAAVNIEIKEYGSYGFDSIDQGNGIFTFQGGSAPNAFNIGPLPNPSFAFTNGGETEIPFYLATTGPRRLYAGPSADAVNTADPDAAVTEADRVITFVTYA